MSFKKNIDKAKQLLIEDKLRKIEYLKSELKKSEHEDEEFDDIGFYKAIAAHDEKWREAKEKGKEYEPGQEWIDMFIDMITHPNIPDHSLEVVVYSEDPLLKKLALKEHDKPYTDPIFTKGMAYKVRKRLGVSQVSDRVKNVLAAAKKTETADFDHLFKSDRLAKAEPAQSIEESENSKKLKRLDSLSFKDLLNEHGKANRVKSQLFDIYEKSDTPEQAAVDVAKLPLDIQKRLIASEGDDLLKKMVSFYTKYDDHEWTGDAIRDRLAQPDDKYGESPDEADLNSLIYSRPGDDMINAIAESPHLKSSNALNLLSIPSVKKSMDEGVLNAVKLLNGRDLNEFMDRQWIDPNGQPATSVPLTKRLMRNPNMTHDHFNKILDTYRSRANNSIIDMRLYKNTLTDINVPLDIVFDHVKTDTTGLSLDGPLQNAISSRLQYLNDYRENSKDDKDVARRIDKFDQELNNVSQEDLIPILESVGGEGGDADIGMWAASKLDPKTANQLVTRPDAELGSADEDSTSWRVSNALLSYSPNLDANTKQHVVQNYKDKDLINSMLKNPNHSPDQLKEYYNALHNNENFDNIQKAHFVKSLAGHPNASNNLIDKMVEDTADPKAKDHHDVNLYGHAILDNYENLTPAHLEKIMANAGDDKSLKDKITNHPKLPEHVFDKIMEQNPAEGEIETRVGSHKLRQLRDFIDERGGEINKKDAEKAGFNLKSLGVNDFITGKGRLSSEAIQNHLDSSPGLKFTSSEDQYGDDTNEDEDAKQEFMDDWDNWPEDARTDAWDAAREDASENFDFDDYYQNNINYNNLSDGYKQALQKYAIEQGQSEEDFNDNPLEYMNQFNDEIFSSNDYDHLSDEAEDLRDGAEEAMYDDIDIGSPSDHPLADWGHEPLWENYEGGGGGYDEAIGEQRHTNEPSQVFQLNLHPKAIREMKKQGVYDTFQNMWDESERSGHPVGENGIGWVRYTKGDDGVHIDEIQSDFGQSFMKQIQKIKQQDPDAASHLPVEEIQKVNDIVFQGHHPSQLLHDSFLQHLRNKGEENTPVHIWQSSSKGPISGQSIPPKEIESDTGETVPVSLMSYKQLKPEHQQAIADWAHDNIVNSPHKYRKAVSEGLYNPDTGESKITPETHDKWSEIAPGEDGSHYVVHKKTKEPLTNDVGHYRKATPLPVHMQQTYDQQPKQMGYKPAKYGELSTQHNPSLQGQDTMSDKVRKADDFEDEMAGGLGDQKKPEDFDQEQLKMGINVEMEHTNDPKKALEIAMDHLTECPDYYTRLKGVEDECTKEEQ